MVCCFMGNERALVWLEITFGIFAKWRVIRGVVVEGVRFVIVGEFIVQKRKSTVLTK